MLSVRERSRAGLALLAAGATAGLLAGVAAAHKQTAGSNKRAAQQAAPGLLAALMLPLGASAVASDPSRLHLLGRAPSAPVTPNLVDAHGFWHVPGTPGSVLRWIEDHPPAGGERDLGGQSGSSSSGVTAQWEGYSFASVAGVLSYRALLVEVAAAAGGGTALRADGQAVWLVPRSGSEWIPAGVRAIVISSKRVNGPSIGPRTVTGARTVKRIVSLVNELPAAQPGVYSCPDDTGPFVTLRFATAPSSGRTIAVADADGSGCGLVSLRIGNRTEPPLTGGPRLIHRLQPLLRTKLSPDRPRTPTPGAAQPGASAQGTTTASSNGELRATTYSAGSESDRFSSTWVSRGGT